MLHKACKKILGIDSASVYHACSPDPDNTMRAKWLELRESSRGTTLDLVFSTDRQRLWAKTVMLCAHGTAGYPPVALGNKFAASESLSENMVQNGWTLHHTYCCTSRCRCADLVQKWQRSQVAFVIRCKSSIVAW